MLSLTLVSFLSSLVVSSIAGSVPINGTCSQDHNHLQVGTFKFDGDCESTGYCSDEGICKPRGCRRDVFPFGYQPGQELPPMCPQDEFCPDESDACQPVMQVGSPCQLHRDDQCQSPPNAKELADSTFGRNFNGSVCLNFECMYQDVTVGLPCIVENIQYIAYGPGGIEFPSIVSRGNCRKGLYCDSQVLQCMQQKTIGESCEADKECETNNCLTTLVCGGRADAARHFPAWVYVVVGIGIIGGMFGTLFGLFTVHRRYRDAEREKRIQYWREQNQFRQNIMQMRDAARASLLSLPLGTHGSNSPRNTMYSRDDMSSEDSQLPILPGQAPKGSGLRKNVADDQQERDDYENSRIVQERENEPRYRNRAF